MRIDAVVVNASPLIAIFRSGQADLLPKLFNRIVVPEEVWKEVVLDERDDAAVIHQPRRSPNLQKQLDATPLMAS